MTTLTGEEILRAALRSGRNIIAWAIAFSFLCNLLRLTGPLFLLLVYDRVISSGSQETLVVLFVLVVTLLITMGMVDYARRRLLARFGAQFQEQIEESIFSSTPRDEFFKTNQAKPAPGLSDLDSIRGFFHSNAVIALLDVFWAPFFLLVVFIFHWVLGLVVLGGLALLTLLSVIKSSFSEERTKKAAAASQDIGHLKDMIRSSKHALRSQSITPSFNQRWLRARRNSRDTSITLSDWTTWFSISSRQLKMLLQYSVLAVGAYLTLTGQTTVGVMITSMFLSVRVFVPVEQFLRELPTIRKTLENWRFLKKNFATRKPLREHEELWSLTPSLTLVNLSKKSPLTGKQILRAINLTAESGSVIEIIGASGSGKTILAETIVGAMQKSGGSIICGGANIERLSLQQATDMFAYVPESAQLIEGTIEENISSLAIEPDVQRVIHAAQLAQIHQLIIGLPEGYQTNLELGNHGLSKGQCHQIAFARALYKQPAILIIDEPDPFIKTCLSENIKQIKESTDAVIVVLSREPVLTIKADQRFLLEEGRLKAKKATEKVVRIDKTAS